MQFKEIILETASLNRTKLFYTKTLELEIFKEQEDAISFKAGKTILTFKKAEGTRPFYHFAFNIINNKFSEGFEWMNNKLDILPTNEDGLLVAAYNSWNAQSFYFYDNNGSILEFIVRFDLPYHTNEPFSAQSITEISEIGLVVSDVALKAEELVEKYKIPHFQYGPTTSDFTAMGDNYGLILLSTPKRPWVPTNKLTRPHPVIIITNEDEVITS